MSITVGSVTILRDGQIYPERIAQLSTEQLETFLVLHACAPNPEIAVQAAVRAVLADRKKAQIP